MGTSRSARRGSDLVNSIAAEGRKLSHFGVKGMRWGVRKAEKTSTSRMIVSDGKAPKVGSFQPVQLEPGGKIEGRIVTKVTEISIPERYKSQAPPSAKAYEIEHRAMTEEELKKPLSSFKHSMPEDTYLAHFGVKGMKWGVRRSREERAAAAEDAVRARQTQAKINKGGVASVESKDLQDLINRMRLEQDYARLKGSETSKLDSGHNKVKKLVDLAKTAQEVHKVATSPFGRALEKELAKKSPSLARRVAQREAQELAKAAAKAAAKEAAKAAKK